MSSIWVKEFTSGLDTRRIPEAAVAGILVVANNGHITRGGEFEQRAAFVPEYELPAGTVGLASVNTGLLVFGSASPPSGMPTGVTYQQLQHADGVTTLVRVLSVDLYQGKPYVVGEYGDGAIFHFYDGVRVTDWYDGRARATFHITGGGVIPTVAAVGSFSVTGGTSGVGNEITAVRIDGVNIISSAVAHTGNNDTTATAIAAAINSHTSSPDYTATASGQQVIITAAVAGAAPNGKTIVPFPAGDVTVAGATNMGGGANTITSRLTDMRINGVPVISGPVSWATSNEATAAAVASAINSYVSVPDYTASASGTAVSVAAATAGSTSNGYVVSFSIENGFNAAPSNPAMGNGTDGSGTFQPGSFVRTIGQKVYSTSGSVMHFSGIQAPTKWTTDTVGAGFIDMSEETSGAEQLMAIARYREYIAVFAERSIQIWYVDPDPNLNKQNQVLNNTGTESAKSVTEFGDADLFYLDESGLRSLRARNYSEAAATTDIGVPVDDLVAEKLSTLNDVERSQVVGLIEPRSGRFWLIMRDTAFVFSFFNGAKVSAWSTYDMSYIDNDGETVAFDVDDAVVSQRRVFVRAGNTILSYGGRDAVEAHDATVAEAWLPFLDANDPTKVKQFSGVDAAIRGQWEVYAAMAPTRPTVEERIAILTETTYDGDGRIPFNHNATHVSLRFRSSGVGPHKLAACVIHFKGSDNDDN